MITAPFNFVPLNEKVFFPPWADDVSHDIPFEDGESGSIDITITAETAMYIRNHYQEGDEYYLNKENKKISTEFCHYKNKDGAKEYYIPSTSIKGMIRNIIEIMSFSKIKVDEKTLSKPLSIRDMVQDKKTGEIFNHPMVATAQKCGFLIKENDNYFIEDCGKTLTIKGIEIKKLLPDYSKDIETSSEKYSILGHHKITFTKETIEKDGRKTTVALYDKISTQKAELVMTGSIDNKKNEFIFDTNGNKKRIDEKVYESFKNVYFLNEDSIDGHYWKKQWNDGEGRKIPVFYIEENNNISAIGLTQIFKLSYKKTIMDAIKQEKNENKLDLSQTIFGTEKEDIALKGRISFSHMKSTNVKYEQIKNEILSTPRPTYYPSYIFQSNTNGGKINKYITLMDESSMIRGYKRYPLHNNIKKSFISDDTKTDIQTNFKPLDKNTIFKGKVRFHNLKKMEIGALISALTFHGNENYRHNIGMVKSLGYGRIKLDIDTSNLKYQNDEYLKSYETEMELFQDNWIESSQIRELFAMSNSKVVNDKNLIYQKLDEDGKNDFTDAKKNKDYLENYSTIINNKEDTLKSFIDKNDIEKTKKDRLIQTEWKSIQRIRNIDQIKSFLSKYPDSQYLDEANTLIDDIVKKEQEDKENKAKEEVQKAFDNLDKSNTKHIESFIKKWQDVEYAQEFISKLNTTNEKESNKSSIDELSMVQNSKKFKSILESNKDNLDKNKELIKSNVIRICKDFNSNKSKKFFKDIQLGRFLDKEFEDEVKNEVGEK